MAAGVKSREHSSAEQSANISISDSVFGRRDRRRQAAVIDSNNLPTAMSADRLARLGNDGPSRHRPNHPFAIAAGRGRAISTRTEKLKGIRIGLPNTGGRIRHHPGDGKAAGSLK